MATHSSILAWKIPWTEEPAGYSPWGHKESDTAEATLHTCMQIAYLGKNRQKTGNSRSLLNRPGTEVGGKYAFNCILSWKFKIWTMQTHYLK